MKKTKLTADAQKISGGDEIRRSCMREHIRDAIVSRILDGQLPPGTRLKELALASDFGVSQAPVREALRELETLGLVESEHYRGTRVRRIDIEDLREAYELRLAIEQAAIRRAVPCSKANLSAMDDELRTMRESVRTNDMEAYMAGVVSFHRRIVEMSGNHTFLRTWESMAWDVRSRIAARRIGMTRLYLDQRKKIVQALHAGDGETAATLLQDITSRLLTRLGDIETKASTSR